MAEIRPKNYPKLKNYQPTRFMLPTSHYDEKKADRAVKFIENLKHTKGKWAGKRFWLLPWQVADYSTLNYLNPNYSTLNNCDLNNLAIFVKTDIDESIYYNGGIYLQRVFL